MLVVRFGHDEGAAQGGLHLGHEAALRLGRVVARGQRGDERPHKSRTVLVAGRLARRQQVVQQKGQRGRLLRDELARLGREDVLGDEPGAAGVRAHQFGQQATNGALRQ